MMYNEVRSGEISCLSFLKGTPYVMYVGPELSPAQRAKLRCDSIHVPVIYLPEILEQLSDEVLGYNFPGVKLPVDLSVDYIYNQIRAEFGDKVTPESRLLVKYDGEALVIFDAKTHFDLVISYLINKCAPKRRFKMSWKMGSFMGDIYDKVHDDEEIIISESSEVCYEESKKESDIRFRFTSIDEDRIVAPKRKPTADEEFTQEMERMATELQAYIRGMLIKGCPPELILSCLNQSVKLSRLRVTRQYKILLVDYDKEIKMGPLPKAVFLFFLRHPEGVMFSHLQDHKKELREIYGRVCTNDDPKKMEESVARLTDPLDNSICEKCAAVKKAFVMNVSDTIAKNYYINGAQGERKGISLDRDLVEWECEL